MNTSPSSCRLPQLIPREVDTNGSRASNNNNKNKNTNTKHQHVFSSESHHDGLHQSTYRKSMEGHSPMALDAPVVVLKSIMKPPSSRHSMRLERPEHHAPFRKTVSFGSFTTFTMAHEAPPRPILKKKKKKNVVTSSTTTKRHPPPLSPLLMRQPDAFQLALSPPPPSRCVVPSFDEPTVLDVVNDAPPSSTANLKKKKDVSPKKKRKKKKKKSFSKALADLRSFLK